MLDIHLAAYFDLMQRVRRFLEDRVEVDLAHVKKRQRRLDEQLEAYTLVQRDLGAIVSLDENAFASRETAPRLPLRDDPKRSVAVRRVLEIRVDLGLGVLVAMDAGEALRFVHERRYNLARRAASLADREEAVLAHRAQLIDLMSKASE